MRTVAARACLSLLCLGLLWACGEEVDPLAPVTGLAAVSGDSVIRLAWTAPVAGLKVVVRRSPTAPPAGPGQGDAVYSGVAGGHADPCLKHGATYHYAAFMVDDQGRASAPAAASGKCTFLPFSLLVMPDSQYYNAWMWKTAMTWILAQQKPLNVAMMLHEGDITHNDTAAEWKTATESLTLMDGKLPYALAVGNHDMAKNGGGDTTNFNKHFPAERMSKLPGFGGSYPAGKMDSSYYTFRAGGADWLVLALVYDPGDAVLAWAHGVVAKHPTRRIIVVTHAYLLPSGSRGAPGKKIWDKLVRKHRGMTLVFNGHYIAGTGARLVSTGDKGNKVYQLFANYQNTSLSGWAAQRIVRLDPLARQLSVKTYGTLNSKYITVEAHQFTYKDVDLGELP